MTPIQSRLAAANLDWLVPDWTAPPNVAAFVTTRHGGVARGARATLDLGPSDLRSLDEPTRAAILENRDRVARFLPAAPVWLEQVHGCDVAVVDASNVDASRARAPVADAAVTRLAEVPLAVRVADCLPVLLADDRGSVVGIAHAGWRGLAAGVIEATIAAMRAPAASLQAWLGPSIGPRAFEVGPDVHAAFCEHAPQDAALFVPTAPDKWLADLPGLARQRLERAGVNRVFGGTHCTYGDGERFFSYRRDRTPARLAALVWRALAR